MLSNNYQTGTAPDEVVAYQFDNDTPGNLTYTGGTGSGFTFSINKTIGASAGLSVQISQNGSGYNTADTIVITGNKFGGASPANDVYLRVVSVNGTGGITDVRVEGSDESSTPTFANAGSVTGKTLQNRVGSGCTFNISNNGTAYSIAIAVAGSNYESGQTFTVPGTELGGSSPTNDATVTVSTTTDQWNAGTYTYGIVSGLNVSGVAPTLPTSFTGIAGSNEAHAGASGTFDITRTQGTYTVSVNAQGSGYRVGNEITVVGTSLGGATTANDALVVVSLSLIHI